MSPCAEEAVVAVIATISLRTMVLAAVGQFCATASMKHNATNVSKLIIESAKVGAKVLFLPEASDYIVADSDQSLELATTIDKSEFIQNIRQTLLNVPYEKRPELSVGVHEPTEDETRVKNTLLWMDKTGDIVQRYQKIHLFDVDLSNTVGGQVLKESKSVEPGNKLVEPFDSSIGKIGASICYDIRFPEQALKLRSKGAQVLLYPSAFTLRTGNAHWEILARARAIDTQSYVIMSAQVGKHDEQGKRQSYGHSLIVDPWGSVIAQCPDVDSEPCIAVADINVEHVEKVRQNMPLWEQRRGDVYNLA